MSNETTVPAAAPGSTELETPALDASFKPETDNFQGQNKPNQAGNVNVGRFPKAEQDKANRIQRVLLHKDIRILAESL